MPPSHAEHTLLAITAHPDDEMGFGSVLAHYARKGVGVHLVALTAGQKGFREHMGIDDPERLARIRRQELRNSSHELGIEPSRTLGFVDQELLGPAQGRIREVITDILRELAPQVVLTFGPEGVTGHPDHRAVSCYVTEILQARHDGQPRLYYHTLSHDHVVRVASRTGRRLLHVDDRYITTRIRVSEEDLEKGLRALAQHRSQFAPDTMREMQSLFRETTREVGFRRVFPTPVPDGETETSLFP